jgi:hypothetical protein
MLLQWFWIPLGALAVVVIYQQLRIYQIHRESEKNEELFQIVTENAADMIALVDMTGRRLYNSPAYKNSGLHASGIERNVRFRTNPSR